MLQARATALARQWRWRRDKYKHIKHSTSKLHKQASRVQEFKSSRACVRCPSSSPRCSEASKHERASRCSVVLCMLPRNDLGVVRQWFCVSFCKFATCFVLFRAARGQVSRSSVPCCMACCGQPVACGQVTGPHMQISEVSIKSTCIDFVKAETVKIDESSGSQRWHPCGVFDLA